MKKLSRAEWAAIAVAAAFLLFFGGWYLRGRTTAAGSYVITADAPLEQSMDTPAPAESFVPDVLLDINEATLEDLEALPGIGEVRARAILEYREANGPFERPEDLTRVSGIGESTYEALAGYITVKEAESVEDTGGR